MESGKYKKAYGEQKPKKKKLKKPGNLIIKQRYILS